MLLSSASGLIPIKVPYVEMILFKKKINILHLNLKKCAAKPILFFEFWIDAFNKIKIQFFKLGSHIQMYEVLKLALQVGLSFLTLSHLT